MTESMGQYYDKSRKDTPKYKLDNLVLFNINNLCIC
jgi:hypothetical protein